MVLICHQLASRSHHVAVEHLVDQSAVKKKYLKDLHNCCVTLEDIQTLLHIIFCYHNNLCDQCSATYKENDQDVVLSRTCLP